jgi:hypothetical protein
MRSQIRYGVLFALLWAGCGSGLPELKAGPMPSGGTFTGVDHSPQYGEMNMIQNGNSVVGEYKEDMRSGKIQGEAEGDLMRFEWTEEKAMVSNRAQETRGHGYFRYVVDPGNGDHVLKGEWGLGDQDRGGGPWNAYKSKGKEPKLTEHTSGGEESDQGSDTEDSSDSEGGSSDDDLF